LLSSFTALDNDDDNNDAPDSNDDTALPRGSCHVPERYNFPITAFRLELF